MTVMTPNTARPTRVLLPALLLTVWVPMDGRAQTAARTPSTRQQSGQTKPAEAPPDTDYAEPVPAVPPCIPGNRFAMPDLPDEWSHYTGYDGPLFSTRFNFVTIVDFNGFTQDADSETQVGEQRDEWDLRTTRLMLRGRMKFHHPVDYFISLEVKGDDHIVNDASKIGFTDFEISTEVGKLGRLKYGKIKEPFVYEMVGDAANLQQQERALSPFFTSRSIGFRLVKTFAGDSMSASAGWFNDWWTADQRFEDSGNEFAGRLTGVPYWSDGGANYLHLGVDWRYVGADEGTLQFRGRPESNVTDYYVDSGKLTADHANELNFESAWGSGPLFFSGEYSRAWVDARDSGDPHFWGTYIAASYVLTGEHRPYDKAVAYARRILPAHRWGAFEVVGRYSHVDVDGRLVRGGIFDRGTIGINWWATRRWKLGFDYGLIDLDRDGLNGVTHAFHSRIQWAY